MQSHLFEPFFTAKPGSKGSGLRLLQVRGFAVQSGGAVTVSGEPGRRTAATIYLPPARRGGRGRRATWR